MQKDSGAKVRKSYDKVTVGKTIWKQIMVTAFMFGKAVIPMTRSNIKKVEAVENSVCRYLLGVGGYATIAALRGDIRASRMETRAMETTLMYIIDMLQSTFEKIKMYLEHHIDTEGVEWMRTAKRYRQEINITWQEIREEDRKALKRRLRDWDTQKWMEEVLHKPTLRWYREVKLYI